MNPFREVSCHEQPADDVAAVTGNSCNVFVEGVPHDIHPAELRSMLELFGTVSAYRLLTDSHSARPRGSALVMYETRQGARNAVREMAGMELRPGKPLRVSPARSSLCPTNAVTMRHVPAALSPSALHDIIATVAPNADVQRIDAYPDVHPSLSFVVVTLATVGQAQDCVECFAAHPAVDAINAMHAALPRRFRRRLAVKLAESTMTLPTPRDSTGFRRTGAPLPPHAAAVPVLPPTATVQLLPVSLPIVPQLVPLLPSVVPTPHIQVGPTALATAVCR